ncbi:O-antigen ligase family protein [Paenibacillus humicus]|uniref:O-antigen ligase family protein n=1 Tax=Paenibacillus humicus TaxID=412861 RepID=UPI000FDBF2A9|nr:O-antigen ligase family protein [Paenibacillus humicus]
MILEKDIISFYNSKKIIRNDIFIRISGFFLAILIFFAVNLPPSDLIPIKFGPFTLNVAATLMLLFFTLISFLSKRYQVELSSADISMIGISCIVLVNMSDIKQVMLFYFMFIALPYLTGKFLVYQNVGLILKRIIGYSGIIQTLIILFKPFTFEASTSRGLFWQMSTQTAGGGYREVGSIGHPIVLATLLLPSFICWLDTLLDSSAKKTEKILSGIFTCLILYSIFLTYSRGAWISLIVATFAILIKRRVFKNTKSYIFATLGALALVVLGGDLVTSISDRFAALNMNDGSLSHRSYMFAWTWDHLSKMNSNFLIGIGYYQSYPLLKSDVPPDGFAVMDNTFLTLIIELGLLGLFFFVFIVGKILMNLKLKYRKDTFITIIIISFLMQGFSFDMFSWEGCCIFLWLLIGYQANNTEMKSVERSF